VTDWVSHLELDVLNQIHVALREAGLEVQENHTYHEGGKIVVEFVAVGPKHLPRPRRPQRPPPRTDVSRA
jgi:hypothetical protein